MSLATLDTGDLVSDLVDLVKHHHSRKLRGAFDAKRLLDDLYLILSWVTPRRSEAQMQDSIPRTYCT